MTPWRPAVARDVSWHTRDHTSTLSEVTQTQVYQYAKTFSLVCKSQLKIDCLLAHKSFSLLEILALLKVVLKGWDEE